MKTNQIMKTNQALVMACLLVGMPTGVATVSAAVTKGTPQTPLSNAGSQLEKKYAERLKTAQTKIANTLPNIDEASKSALLKAQGAVKAARAAADEAKAPEVKINGAKALVEHAKGKWIGGAEKKIAKAQAALKKATTETEREAALKDLAEAEADKEAGVKALKERQAALDKARLDASKMAKTPQMAQATLAKAQADEIMAAKALLTAIDSSLSSDNEDATLVICTVLTEATPHGLAEFAQQGSEQAALVDKLLADTTLMKQMLEAGGAKFGKFGRAMEIYTTIQKARPKTSQGVLQRLALATSLEHAVPVAQSNPQDQTNAPASVDPLNRYLHYEKAYLDGELDPAFKYLSTWEYRLVVDCDAPDAILAWGREMLRNYRPDYIYTPDYGWRYSCAVRTEVPYGSQNVKNDVPSLQTYQNIIKDGGVCGRRAFFGRFILRSFGIPTWGVTQHAHAALSHWTPKGWVCNLGAGFEWSWWDKDEAVLSGTQFLLETQARAHVQDYLKVLRAQWISRILGEPAYNERKKEVGGFWSSMAHYQSLALAATAVALGPLGQELAEANEPKGNEKIEQTKVTEADRKATAGRDGVITIPAVAHSKPTGPFYAMKSFAGGMQLHCTGGYKANYDVNLPNSGKYALSARVATVQEGQKFQVLSNDAKAPVEIAVPYTLGKWQQTQPIELSLVNGYNVIHFSLLDGSRGVTLKEFTLTPVQ